MKLRLLLSVVLAAVAVYSFVHKKQQDRRPLRLEFESGFGDSDAHSGFRLVQERRYADAIPLLQRALGKPRFQVPTDTILAALGESYAALGESYLALPPEDGGEKSRHFGWTYTAMAHATRGEMEKAEAAYRRALELSPSDPETLDAFGVFLVRARRTEEGVALLERSVDADPSTAQSRAHLAVAYAAAGRFESAELQVNAAERLGWSAIDQLREQIARLRAGETVR